MKLSQQNIQAQEEQKEQIPLLSLFTTYLRELSPSSIWFWNVNIDFGRCATAVFARAKKGLVFFLRNSKRFLILSE